MVLGINTEWCIAGLLVVIIILVIFGIDQYKVRKNAVSTSEEDTLEDDLPWGEELPKEEDEEILPFEEETPEFSTENGEEKDELASLLKAYIELGAKEELSIEEKYQYACLSQLLAQNYVCVGCPEI